MRSRRSASLIVVPVLACVLAFFTCLPSALGQSATTGALTGTVTDPSGAVISSATVTVTDTGTGQSRSATTNGGGSYTFSLLPPGNYRVKFSASGFQTAEVPSIPINITATSVLNRALALGSQSQQIMVEANAETIQTQNATVGSLVSGNTVTSLPLSTRNFTQIIDLSPGVVANVSTATAVGNGTQDINVNGSGSDQNTYMMDGVTVTNYGSGGAAQSGSYAGIPIPNPDSLQEFKVQTSQYDAAYGQNPGANVNVVTKSGTNTLHGSVWEFNRNNLFNANDYFYKFSELSSGLPNKPPTVKQNQYGGTIGGPIKKNRIFFFGSYQGTRQLNGIGSNGFATAITQVSLLPFNEPGVPFAKARADAANGGGSGTIPRDFIAGNPACSYATYRQYLGCAFGGTWDPASPALGTGVIVAPDGSNISNTAINLLRQTEKIPQAQGGFNNGYYIPSLRYNPATGLPFCDVASGACSTPTTISQPTIANEDQFMINTDFVVTPHNTVTEKYFFSKDPQTQSFSCIVTGCYPGAPEDARYGSQIATVRLTSVIGSNVVNEVFGSFNRLFLNVADGVTVQSCAGDGITPLNITPAVNDGAPCPLTAAAAKNREDSLVPVIGTIGVPDGILVPGRTSPSPFVWGAWSAGGNFFSATQSIQNNFITGDQLSWNRGKHSFRFGVNTQRIQWNWAQPNRERGWIIAGNEADILTSSSGPAVDGTAFAPINWVINSTWRLLPNGSENPHHWRINEFSSYAQDDFKVSRTLTLNLGVRWEYDGWPTDAGGVFTNFTHQAAGLVNTGSFFLNNPGGTLAGYVVQSNYNRALYGNLTGQFGSTGIVVNNNKTVLPRAPLNNFSPRLGLAWQPMDKLVVRAGYGMFFDRVYGNLVGDNILGNMPPYATGVGITPGQTLQNPFCTPAGPGSTCPQFLGFIPRTLVVAAGNASTGATTIADFLGGNASGLLNSGDSAAMRTPKVQEYNLDVQYEFAKGWVADIGYVGSHGIHLYDWNRNPNLAYLVDCGAASAICNPPTDKVNQLLERPAGSFPMNDSNNTNPATQVLYNTSTNYLGRVGYLGVNPGNLQQVETDGAHLYDSLQLMLRHNFANGLLIQASYTWSNLKTDINASQAGAGIATPGNVLSGSASSNDPLNVRQQYGPAAFNRPQRFVLTYSYDLPYKGEGWHGKLLGGWGVSGVTTIQDGLPFSVTDGESGSQATLLYGTSIPATGPYARAEYSTPIDCNSFGNCKSGVSLNTSGGMNCRLGLPTKFTGCATQQGFINPTAFAALPQFGGAPNQAGGPFTGVCSGTNPQFIGCGTGFGNSGVGIMRCCTQLNFDAAIIKNTVVGGLSDSANLEFRAEFYNLFNHSQFNEPGNGFGTTTFGDITSSSVPGRILQFGLKYTF